MGCTLLVAACAGRLQHFLTVVFAAAAALTASLLTACCCCCCCCFCCCSPQSLRAVKGILNKLTPEKYERLLNQLLEVVATADLLKQTISLVFENAVAQPTFCAM
jgi:hypothetical protein